MAVLIDHTNFGSYLKESSQSRSGTPDGNIYFGSMPHHPTRGTPIFRYAPAADKVEVLGDFDEIAQNKGPGVIPNRRPRFATPNVGVHTSRIQLDGPTIIRAGFVVLAGGRVLPSSCSVRLGVARADLVCPFDVCRG